MAKRTRWFIPVVILAGLLWGPGIIQWGRLALRQYRLDQQHEALRELPQPVYFVLGLDPTVRPFFDCLAPAQAARNATITTAS